MSYQITISPNGKETFKAICDQLQQRWNVKTVNQFKHLVVEAMEKVIVNPYLYPIYNEETGLRKCVLHKNCSMLYRIQGNQILVACFWDNRQNPIFLP